jgi:hypothetical protein
MTGFSASDAAIDGFRVIREKWRLIVGWSAFNLLALIILVVVATISIFIAAAVSPSPEAATTAGAVIGFILAGLGTMTVEAVIVAGLYRAVLRPDEPGFLGLRLGLDEIRLVVVWVALITFAGVVSAIAMNLAGPLGQAGGTALSVAVLLAILAATFYVFVRLSLAGPMTFDRRRITLAGSWRLTRGRFWALLGMCALVICLLALAAVLGWFLMLGLTGLLFGFQGMTLFPGSDAEAMVSQPGPYLFQLTAQLLFAPVLWVIVHAPLAAAYKAFRDPQPATEA